MKPDLAARLVAILLGLAVAACANSGGEDHAVILVYHHVADDTPRSTSVTPEEFSAQLDLIEAQGFTVRPLPELARALAAGRRVPPNSVAISFDDAYRSVYDTAWPALAERGWPFTVFVSSDAVDEGWSQTMSWDQLRKLEAGGATIANHSSTHEHLLRRRDGESPAAWRERIAAGIEQGQQRLEAELDAPPRLFAYPYGEFDADLEDLVAELGFIGFGQQSGPAGFTSSPTSLPRFPVASGFTDLDALLDKLHSRPLPITVLEPESRVLAADSAAPTLRARLTPGDWRRDALTCFVSGQPAARIEWQQDVARITARQPLRAGRSKYNCTAPSASEPGVFYWFSQLWIKPLPDGSWYQG